MPTTPRKAAASKKAQVQELPVLEFELTRDRVTPGAFRFAEDTEPGAEPISGSLYLRKSHLDGVSPVRIRVTAEVLEVED